MLQNQIISYIRVAVVLLVGALLTWAAQSLHIVVSPHTKDGLVTLAMGVVGLVYYVAVRALEHRWPRLGLLLGVPAKPTYPVIGKPKDAGLTIVEVLIVLTFIGVVVLVFIGRIR